MKSSVFLPSSLRPILGFHHLRRALLAIGALLIASTIAHAAITITGSTNTPTVTTNDQYLLLGNVDDVQNIGGPGITSSGQNDASTYVASDRTSQGQTFTTGTNSAGYTVSSVIVQHVLWNTFLNNGTFYNVPNGGVFKFQFGAVTGTNKTALVGAGGGANATFSGTGFSGSGTSGTGTYFTFDLSQAAEQTAIGTLAPNTTYYFEIASSSPYFEMNGVDNGAGLPVYANGTAFRGTTTAAINSSFLALNGDRAFVIKLTPVPSGTPNLTAAVNPTNAARYDAFTVTATATPNGATVTNVSVDLSPVGGSASASLVLSNANVYTNSFTVPSSVGLGQKALTVTAKANNGATNSTQVLLNVVTGNRVWDGGSSVDNNWTSNTNWTGNVGPIAAGGDSATFDGTNRLAPYLDANYSLSGLTFSTNAGPFVIGTAAVLGSTVTLSAGSALVNNSANPQTVNVPIAGAGGVTQNGSGTLTLGKANTYTGVTTVSKGSLAVPTGGQINSAGTGGANLIVVGNTAAQDTSETFSASFPVLTISGGAVNAVTTSGSGAWDNYVQVGNGLNFQGFVNMTSGSFSASRHLVLGNNGGFGAMTMSGGTLTVGSYFPIGFGAGGSGVFNLIGGTVTQNQTGGAGTTLIGSGGGSIGVMTVSGGTFTATAGGIDLPENDTSTGILNISGTGAVTVGNTGIQFGNSSSAVAGTLNLLGGTLTANILHQVGGNSTVNFNGGTLKASGASTTFMQGLGGAYLYGGGATINDNGFAITIGQPLLTPPGSGVSATGLSITPGNGYLDTPIVTISGGGGSGATAVATVSGGQVTGITITSPGIRYTSFPTFTLSGGGGTGASVVQGSATLAANIGGGLSKIGAGTLSLSASNTYAGATVIKTGTLALTGAGDITGSSIIISNGATFNVSSVNFTLKNGQSLQGRGTVNGSMTAASGSAIYPGTDGTAGTNTFNNNLTFASGATCYFDIGTTATASNDRINVGGNLTANFNKIHLKAPSISVGIVTNADYILMGVTGTVSGSFLTTPIWDIAPTNASHFVIVTDAVSKQVRLHYTTNTPPAGAGFAAPSNPLHFQNVTLHVTATPGSSPISSVVVDLSPLGMSSSQVMTNDGTGTNFNYSFTVGAAAQAGSYALQATIIDSIGLSGSASIPLTITAANLVWDGGGANDNWNTGANWAGNVPPGSGDTLTFAGAIRPTPFLEGNYTIPSLTFDPTAGSFNIGSGGSTLTLPGNLINNSFSAQTISAPINLSGTATFTTSAGAISVNNGISGTCDLVKAGTGLLVLTGTNTYSGNTVINGGTLRVTGTGQLYAGAANNASSIFVNSNATLELDTWFTGSGMSLGYLGQGAGQIVVDGGTIRMKGTTGYGRGVTVNAGGATFEAANGADWFLNIFTDDGGFICNGDPNIIFTGAGVGSFDKTITGGGSLIKRGTGTWTIGRPQSYTGSTIVEQGQLCLRKPYLTTNSTVSIAQGAVLKLLFYDGDAIGALVLGGTNMPPGTYSRATHPQFIIGPGTLVVGGTTNIYNGVPLNYTLDSSTDGTGVPYVMSVAAAYHNDWGFNEISIWTYYNSGIPTAQANCGGPIGFGGLIAVYDAMHEINHCLGSGTCWTYNGGLWTGPNANRLIKQIDGPAAYIVGDSIHFWPYNFNYGNEFSDRNAKVAVRIIEALRRDAGMLNQYPTVSSIASRSIPVNGNTGALPFTVGDAETAAGSLTVAASSSNTNLIPAANIVLGGSGASRTVTVTPVSGQSGVASITLLVNDGMDTVSTTFSVVVGSSYTWNVADGNWDTNTANWTGAGTVWPTNGAIGNFGSSGHTITVLPGITTYGLNFTAAGYLLQGNPLALTGLNTISNAAGATATITAAITSDGGLAKSGPGTLSLSGANTFGDVLNLNAGAMNFANSSSVFGGSVSSIGNLSANGAALYNDGTLNMSAAATGAGLNLGNTSSAYGYLRNSGDTTLAGHLWLGTGSSAASVLDIVGGTVTVSGTSGTHALQLNDASVVASSGINITGGTLALNLANDQNLINNTAGDYASLNVIGSGKMTLIGDAGFCLNNVNSSTSVSTFTVASGGELDMAYCFNNNASAVNTFFNFNGGTVVATATDGNGLFINNTKIYVYSGGAIINANGSNPNVNQPLLAPTGNGVTGISLGGTTTGYIGAPLVKISGGGGGGAAAIANFNPTTGTITGITVTAPGSGYTSVPTVSLVGGTVSGAAGGTATATASIGAVAGGGLTKTGAGTLKLNAANTYSGGTTISSGTVALGVNGSIANSSVITVNSGATFDIQALSNANFTLGASQTLKGDGTILGPAIINGTVAPGVSMGTLTFATPPTLNGTTLIELNRTNAQTCDRLQVSSGTLTYGGKLMVTNVGPFVKTGDSFQLFTASGYAGTFSTTNLPSLPGLVWNFNASSGVLSVVQAVATNPTNISCTVSGGSLTLSWPADHIGWHLQAQTNSLSTGLGTNWVDVPASSSTNSMTIPLNANNGSVFYRMVYP